MMQSVRYWSDRLLGRGSAAITVPVMDGALKANRVLDEATVVAELAGIDDLASDGDTIWASAGKTLWRLADGQPVPVRRFDEDITAIAARPGGRLAVALGGRAMTVYRFEASDLVELARRESLHCVNAMAFERDDCLVFSEGSLDLPPADWCRDLMSLGHSGRVGRWNPVRDELVELARNLRYAFGVLPRGQTVLASESWRHRVLAVGATLPSPSDLPAYPSRMTPAAGGGFWLSCFASRTQLVEFVLREPAYRRRMLAEVDPRYWIAPALSSGRSFLEPLQGAGVKQMGVLKPWAPPRSYGLVLRIGAEGRVLGSWHSQVDGRHHGITGLAEHQGRLHLASKGSGRWLSVALDAGDPS